MTTSRQRTLVAGGAGFIGANLVRRLLAEGHEVRATIHRRPAVIDDSRVEYVQADLTDADDCRRVSAGIDCVFMCAASTSGAAVMAATPLVHVTPNVVMNTLMLEAAYEAQVKRFVFISSSTVYPPTGDRPVTEAEALDGEPYQIYFSVGWMKRYAEILCRIYAEKIKKSMSTVVVRPSNVYGPFDDFDFRTSHMMAALLRRTAERQNPFEVWGDGRDVKDLIYIDDFLDGLLLAAARQEPYVAVNIAAGRGWSVREILQTILQVDGFSQADVRFDASKPTVIPVRLLDTTFAAEQLGFTPRVALDDGIRRTLAWYRTQDAETVSASRRLPPDSSPAVAH
jgi:GDP-L-fucose synthase